MSAAWGRGPLAPAIIFIAVGLLYTIGLGRYPHVDELYHVLAARGWIDTGTPRIAEGLYWRDLIFTRLIAGLFATFGESLSVARVPSLLAVTASATLLFVWIRREAGLAAAVLTTLLFSLSPFALEIAQFTRGYAIQSLSFLVACLSIYEIVIHRPPLARALGFLVAAIAGLALALHLHIASAVGIAGLLGWATLVAIGPWFLAETVSLRRKLIAGTAAAVMAIALFAAALSTGLLGVAMLRLAETNLAIAERAGQVWYYHLLFLLFYPTLWTLVPVLALAALARWPQPAFLALCIFAVAFLAHSFAAAKNLRYLFYALPFLFVLWGLGLTALAREIVALVRGAGERSLSIMPPMVRTAALAIVLAATLGFVLLANAATVRTVALLAQVTVPPERPSPRWEPVRAALADDLANADVVVTSSELEQLYFLGRYDVLISGSRLNELDPVTDFTPDFRTGRPVIAGAAGLERLMDCFASGLVVTPRARWREDAMLGDDAADLLVARAEPIALPASNVMAFRWDHPAASPESCPVLPTLTR